MQKYILIFLCLLSISIFIILDNKEEPVEIVEIEKEYKAYVKGEVMEEGVYNFSDGERVIDIIEKAGGFKESADISTVNLSLNLVDEMVIEIPRLNYQESVLVLEKECLIEPTKEIEEAENGLVNINTAGVDEFLTLTGIGETKAQAIIDHRKENGAFLSVEDLTKVKGIGDSTLAKIKEDITI